MKNSFNSLLLVGIFSQFQIILFAQNVGIGTPTPEGKLHIQGSENVSQLVIDANGTQANTNPLIKIRNSSGMDLMWIHSDHQSNIFIGVNAGGVNNANNGGTGNIFLGRNSGNSNTIGYWNTAIGSRTLFSNTLGSSNTANGMEALFFNTIGTQNTANGVAALFSNTSGKQNVAIGNYALATQSYNPGSAWLSDNVAVGFEALYNNQPTSTFTGIQNTAVGNLALRANTTGYSNTANGYAALYSNTTGNFNTANGQGALYSNTEGNYNTANGYGVLASNTVGAGNTAQGANALYANTTADRNTAIGYYSLSTQSYNPGSFWISGNVAVGYQALYLNQPTSTGTGIRNTAVGNEALRANTIGYDNVAIGSAALWSNTTGSSNTAIGYAALYLNTIGNFNTAIGQGALYFNAGGHHNIAIGYGCGTVSGSPYVTNTISIGNDNILNAASNQAFIGNTSTSYIGGQVNWSTYASDARVKNNTIEDVKGLDFIIRLRPVTYYLDTKAMAEITGNKQTEDYPGKYDIEKIKFSGFLAQEVENAAKLSGYDFSGITVPKKSTDLYTLRYAEFVVPLVKAVQELNEQLKSEVASMKSENEKLTKRIEKLELLFGAKNK